MSLTCYCKHCGREVPPSDACPVCGSKLSPAQAHLTWRIMRTPVLDWMCWNAVMRIVLPVLASVLILALWMEILSGGLNGIDALISGGLPGAIAIILVIVTTLVLLVLILRGKELLVCSIDSKGLHIERYLPDPTVIQLLARLKPPAALTEHPDSPLLMDISDVAWKDINRVQLWPERSYIILYSPAWWQCMAMPAAPQVWNDALEQIRQRIGKKKGVILPYALQPHDAAKPVKASVPLPKPVHANQHARPFEGMEQATATQAPKPPAKPRKKA